MHETSKSILRRTHDQRFATRYFVGDGIDIGAGPDTIGQYQSLFPLMGTVKAWDTDDGDAMLMAGVAEESYQFVYSSHCLEHLVDPVVAVRNWVRICKPGGYLVIVVPDEDLYEQGVWPSTFNNDHKWTFTTGKTQSWNARSLGILSLLAPVLDQVSILRMELLDMAYIYNVQRLDQTQLLTGECAIEIVLRRYTSIEAQQHGRFPA
jgi:SAM-dependent methyltransferase